MRTLVLLLATLTGCNCATPASATPKMEVKFTEDTHLDHDQVLACVWVRARKVMVCMTPEEFSIRAQQAADEVAPTDM